MMKSSIALLAAVLLGNTLCDAALPTKATIALTRSLLDPQLDFEMSEEAETVLPDCDLQMDQPILMSHPQSLNRNDRYFVLGSTSYEAVAMTVDFINTQRCGVHVQGKNYPILLRTLGDDSDPAKHTAAGNYLANSTDFFLAGYSSLLTQHLAPIAQAHGKIMVAGGSSRTAIYQDREYAFGILPPGHLYLDQALQAVASVGARSVASITEDGLDFICGNVPSLADKYGLQLVDNYNVGADPGLEELSNVAANMSMTDPDVVVTCTFDGGCARWIQSMREHDWSPKAQVFTLCIGLNELEQEVGDDVSYMMGASSWDKNLPPIPDAVTGWTPGDFAQHFEAYAFKNATYQNAAAATSVSILVQAIELANSLDTDLVRAQLASQSFPTMYGRTSFDTNGQNNAPSTLFQYDTDMKLHVVYPPEDRAPNVELVYPMPTFRHRDCLRLSSCEATGGTCRPDDGTCDCSQADLGEIQGGDWEQVIVSLGAGPTASCKLVPNESMSYISDIWISVGYGMVAIQGVLSLTAIGWTLFYRQKPVVIASQPLFLILTAVGCFIMVAAIIPLSIEGEYRYVKDETTGQLTNQTNPDIDRVDAACMMAPWFAGMGFAIIFGALFAKILRIKFMLDHASGHKRKAVEVKDVVLTMFVIMFVEAAVLLAWTLADPMQWHREIILTDADDFVLQSVGSCQSENTGIAFYAPLTAVNALGLVYALWLCYVTRLVPSDFAEGRWITISVVSIFQILLLAVPVLVIADEDPTASFFVRAGVVFLMGSSVTLLMFVPKMRTLAFGRENDGQAIRVRFQAAVEAHREAKTSSREKKSSRSHDKSHSLSRSSKARHDGSVARRSVVRSSGVPSISTSTDQVEGEALGLAGIRKWASLSMGGVEEDESEQDIIMSNVVAEPSASVSQAEEITKKENHANKVPSHVVHRVDETPPGGDGDWNHHHHQSSFSKSEAAALPKQSTYTGYNRDLVRRIHERRRQALGLDKLSNASESEEDNGHVETATASVSSSSNDNVREEKRAGKKAKEDEQLHL